MSDDTSLHTLTTKSPAWARSLWTAAPDGWRAYQWQEVCGLPWCGEVETLSWVVSMLFVCLCICVCMSAGLCAHTSVRGLVPTPECVYLTCLGIQNPPVILRRVWLSQWQLGGTRRVVSCFIQRFIERMKTLCSLTLSGPKRITHTYIQTSNMHTHTHTSVTFSWLQGIVALKEVDILSFEPPRLIGAGPRPLPLCECICVCSLCMFCSLVGLYSVTFPKISPGCLSYSLDICEKSRQCCISWHAQIIPVKITLALIPAYTVSFKRNTHDI